MKTLIIHHSVDFDGIFCRQIANRYFNTSQIKEGRGPTELVGWDYGDPLPTIAPDVEEIYMLDISIEGMMDDPRLIWIDHHASAMAKFNPNICGYRIDGVAACRLAYQWFFTYNNQRNPMADHFATLPKKQDYLDRNVHEPMAVMLAGEYDIWDRRDPRAEIFQHGLRSMDLDIHWGALLGFSKKPTIAELEAMSDVGHTIEVCPDGTVIPPIIHSLLANGRVLQYAKTKENESIAKHNGFTFRWEGLTFLAINAARYNSHLFTAGLKPEHDGCFGFNFDGSGWKISLYGVPGKPDIDLAKIAVKHGGGGHKQACGFKSKTLPFTT